MDVAAVDLGASSGRVMLGRVGPGVLELKAVARFPNEPVRLPSGLHWNLPGLYQQALAGLREATKLAPIASIGIDSWAVDYGLVREGRLAGLPFHYRDEVRTGAGPKRVHGVVDQAALYQRHGLQFLPFTTLYQLAADPEIDPAGVGAMLVPDLLGYWLTGRAVTERTNASTTGLLDVRTREWDTELMGLLGLPDGPFPPLVDPGTRIGGLLPHVCEEVGADVPVVTVASHDTASAVVGTPMLSDDAAYISLGTWGLVGLELDAPVLTEAAREANFTNEAGVDGTVRFLTNVMGTWLLSETLRAWSAAGGPGPDDLGSLLDAAADLAPTGDVVDVQDPRFAPPGDMPSRIAAWCSDHDAAVPEGYAAMVRLIIDSLAAAYAAALQLAGDLAGRRIDVVHVVGGGAQNTLLCQTIADRTGLPVLAGPVEATAIGNVLIQGRAAGAGPTTLAAMRELVHARQEVRRFEPGFSARSFPVGR